MYKIRALIVEDDPLAIRRIRDCVAIYNKDYNEGEFCIDIVAEARDYISAVTEIGFHKNIEIIFLDINLPGEKSGLDIFKMYPSIPYIIVSENERAYKDIIRNTSSRPDAFVDKMASGLFDNHELLYSIQKFIKERRESFYTNVLVYEEYSILLSDVILISRNRFLLEYDLEKHKNVLVKIQEPRGKTNDNHYFSYNRFRTSLNNSQNLILDYNNIRENDSEISLKNIISRRNLNRRAFVRVSDSSILNLDHAVNFDRSKNEFTLRILTNEGSMDSPHTTLVFLKIGESTYLTPEVKSRILTVIRNRSYRK